MIIATIIMVAAIITITIIIMVAQQLRPQFTITTIIIIGIVAHISITPFNIDPHPHRRNCNTYAQLIGIEAGPPPCPWA